MLTVTMTTSRFAGQPGQRIIGNFHQQIWDAGFPPRFGGFFIRYRLGRGKANTGAIASIALSLLLTLPCMAICSAAISYA
ncbi:hypothetical protein RO575_00810 [Methylomonas sp. MO1]|uniref:hypothetical protein n=1 Tax=Methylomonas sp. MO1 TaxID=3073619 RepID=UPI0028A41973|nr:hypothetical protein [Methylomonas sp. MO1]MDT4288092.1 hypothetical protein [Methylomonas sp. MO1]